MNAEMKTLKCRNTQLNGVDRREFSCGTANVDLKLVIELNHNGRINASTGGNMFCIVART